MFLSRIETLNSLKYIIVLAITSPAVLASGLATLCGDPMPGHLPGVAAPAMTMGDAYIAPDARLQVRVGDKEMIISPSSGGKITGLDMGQRHLIEIIQDKKMKISFWLSFQDYNKNDPAHLCLMYYKGYGTFSIQRANKQTCLCG